ncbi:hypothetical protein Tco_1302801, partial [Tanacetum coccineum]
AGQPVVESRGGGTGRRVGRGSGRGRGPREGNDERVDKLNGQGNDQGLGANGNVEGVNRNVDRVNGGVGGALDFSKIIAQQLQNLLPAILAQEYDGKGGAVVLTRWIEKMESVQDMSGVLMMIEEFCPSHEMQKLETELWNYVMVGAGHVAYTDIFHELARLVPHLVTPEIRKIKRQVYGLAPQICGKIEKMESVQDMSGCSIDQKVKYTVKALIDKGVADALAARDADRSMNGDDSHNSGTGVRRNERVARECTYPDFMKCQPLNFKGTEGVLKLTQWFEKMEMCSVLVTMLAYAWGQLGTGTEKEDDDKYCFPRSELKSSRSRLWNLKVKDRKKIHTFAERQTENKGSKMFNKPTNLNITSKETRVAIAYTAWLLKGWEYRLDSTIVQQVQVSSQWPVHWHYRSDCPELKNQNHGNQAEGTGASGAVHALGGGETNQDLNNMEDDINVGPVTYKLELPQELSSVQNTFHVSNLEKCYSDDPLAVPLDGLDIKDKLHFVEEPVEIMDREVKRLKRSRIPIVKV